MYYDFFNFSHNIFVGYLSHVSPKKIAKNRSEAVQNHTQEMCANIKNHRS